MEELPLPILDKTLKEAELAGPENLVEHESDMEEVRHFYIEKLRDPHINAFFKYLRNDPALWQKITNTYKKRQTFLDSAHRLERDQLDQQPDHIRLLAPLISAIATTPEVRASFQLLLDEAAQYESQTLRESIEDGHNYVQRLVVGGGLMGAIFNSEFLHQAPEASSLTVEQNAALGGQFRQYGSAVISMNTQNAPFNKEGGDEISNIDPNSFGPHAPIELGDLSGDLFADNEMIGLAAALNQYLTGHTLLNNESYRASLNTSENPGKFKVEIKEETGTSRDVYTDGIITLSGIGESSYGLPNADSETQSILDKESAQYEQTKHSHVLTYGQFLSMIGDPTNDFPLEPFIGKRVGFVGGGHSSLTGAEALAHLGPEHRGSVSTLGGPKEIVILGTSFANREEFLAKELPRYGQLAAIMARKESHPDSKDPLVTVMPGVRVRQLRESGEGLTLQYADKTAPSTDALQELGLDYVVFTTGFEDTTLGMFEGMLDDEETNGDIGNFPAVLDQAGKAIARHLPGNPDIVFGGAAAHLAQGERELAMADIYNMPHNPASMFSNMRNVVELARKIGTTAKEERTDIKTDKELRIPKREKTTIEPRGESLHRLTFSLSEEVEARTFPSTIRLADFLSINIRAELGRFSLPAGQTELVFNISRTEESFTVDSPGLDRAYLDVVQTIFEDTINQSLVARLTDPALRRSSHLVLKLPLERNKEELTI
ncbi:MAG: hypothetical protein JWN50_5 [Parcubacteria group bacterium]|nr:hypothetical protein [Parcubacteria group bacterium]